MRFTIPLSYAEDYKQGASGLQPNLPKSLFPWPTASGNAPLWFDKLTTSGQNPPISPFRKGGYRGISLRLSLPKGSRESIEELARPRSFGAPLSVLRYRV